MAEKPGIQTPLPSKPSPSSQRPLLQSAYDGFMAFATVGA
jgi:hypothetical protein